MIGLIAKSINFCVTGVVWVLATAAFVGQLIVSAATSLVSAVWSVCGFFAEVYYDNRSLIALELPAMVLGAPATVWAYFVDAGVTISASLATAAESFCACTDFVSWNVLHTLMCVKNLSILIGESVWLLIRFVPMELPALLAAVCARAYVALMAAGAAAGEVPLEATAGLVACAALVRSVVEYREVVRSCLLSVYWWFRRRVTLCYYTVYHYWMDDDTLAVRRLVADDAGAGWRRRGEGEEAGEPLCVVCQERHKCVLTLPCRHICLCCECCVTLYSYQRTCPICRTFICHSVNVYF